MRVGLDVMGGDFVPQATIEGAIEAQNLVDKNDRIVLIGDEKIILKELISRGANPSDFDIVHAESVMDMGEHPTRAFKNKPDSSIAVGFQLLKGGEIDSFSSAGNSGAMLVGSVQIIGIIEGISRPATAAIFPRLDGKNNFLLDVGTTIDSKPENLLQFAILGKLYAENVFHQKDPKIGLLNIGEEKEKGNILSRAAYQLLEEAKMLNFIGNVEGRDLFKQHADIIVCDGFIGNIVLKQAEAFYRMVTKLGYTGDYLTRLNYENYGGTPILGAKAPVTIGHGISNAKAIKNMILHAKEMAMAKLPEKISEAIQNV